MRADVLWTVNIPRLLYCLLLPSALLSASSRYCYLAANRIKRVLQLLDLRIQCRRVNGWQTFGDAFNRV